MNTLITCIVTALVSSAGHVINVDNLRQLKTTRDGGCNVYQIYSPPVIKSDWSCRKVERNIIHAIAIGCGQAKGTKMTLGTYNYKKVQKYKAKYILQHQK